MPSHCRFGSAVSTQVRSFQSQRGSRTNAAVQWNDIVHQPFAFRKDRVLRHEEIAISLSVLILATIGFSRSARCLPRQREGARALQERQGLQLYRSEPGLLCSPGYSYRRSNRDAVAAGVAERSSAVPWAPWPSRHTAPTSVRRMATPPLALPTAKNITTTTTTERSPPRQTGSVAGT